MHLQFGRIKISRGNTHGGHNGVKSVDRSIGKGYTKIRFGINNGDSIRISEYVLEKFSQIERLDLQRYINKIAEIIHLILENRVDLFLNKYYLFSCNLSKHTPRNIIKEPNNIEYVKDSPKK